MPPPAFDGLLLLPVQLTNKADPTKRNGANGNDVSINLVTSGSVTSVNSVAWIAGNDPNNNNAPRMPHLVATSGSISGLNVEWKLSVIFHDMNGDPYRDFDTSTNLSSSQIQEVEAQDDVTIPATNGSGGSDPTNDNGWRKTNGTWNIYQDPDWTTQLSNAGFFGGDAVLSMRILDSNGNVISPEQDYQFRIAGENPDPTLCKTYINSVCGSFWFAYAIAKEETNNDGGNPFYNNFLYNGGGGVTKTQSWPGHEGRPDWNNDTYYSRSTGWHYTQGSGGYGLFQLTYGPSETNFIMPRDWIWNWQSNTVQAMVDLSGKATPATNLYNYLVANAPSIQSQRCPTSGNDVGIFNAYEGILVCLNNGNAGFTKFEGNGKRTPWTFNISTGVWTFTGTYAISVAGFVE